MLQRCSPLQRTTACFIARSLRSDDGSRCKMFDWAADGASAQSASQPRKRVTADEPDIASPSQKNARTDEGAPTHGPRPALGGRACPRMGLPAHLCAGTRLTPATSAPGPASPLPHPHRDRPHASHICPGTGLTPVTSAPGLGSRLPHLHQDWAHRCHICTGTGLTPTTSAPGSSSSLPHLH